MNQTKAIYFPWIFSLLIDDWYFLILTLNPYLSYQIDSNTQSYNLTFPQPKPNEHERPKLLKIKVTLERNIAFLKVSKSDISYALKEQLPLMEDQIITFVKVNRSLDHHLRYKLYLLSMRGNLEEFILSKTDFD